MDALTNPRAIAGDNQPPLGERLALDHADLVKSATEAAALVPESIRAIETDEEAAIYTDTAADIKKIVKLADAAFKTEKEPWLAGGRTVETFFAFRAGLNTAVARVVRALEARQNAMLAAQRKAEAEEAERARKAAEADLERARKEAEAFDEPPPPVVVPVYVAPVAVKEAVRIVSASGAKTSGSIKWVGIVEKPEDVPRMYLMVNQAAIDAAVKGGVRSIPGVNIQETMRTSIRA